MVDLEAAVRYPTRKDDWLSTVAAGGGLLFGSQALTLIGSIMSMFLLVLAVVVQPLVTLAGLLIALPVFGYYVDVLRSTLDGAEAPPTFADLSARLKDGLAVIAITVAYLVPLVVIAATALVVGMVVSSVANDQGLLLLVVGLLGVPIGGLYAVLSWYLLPISVALYVRDGLAGTMAVGRYRSIATDRRYAVRWLVAFAAWVIGGLMAQWLLVFVVGFFVLFYTQVVAVHQIGLGVRAAIDDDTETTGEPKSDEPSAESPATAEDRDESPDGAGDSSPA